MCSFKTKASAEVLLPYEQNLQYPKGHRTTPPLNHSQETNVGGRRVFSRAAGATFNQNGIRPGSVWDRLGKPTENDTPVKHVNGCANMKRRMLERNLQWIGQNTWLPSVLDGEVKNNLSQNCNVKTYRSNGCRQRQLNDFIRLSSTTSDTWDHEEENFRKFTVEPENYTCMLKESDISIPEITSQDKLGVGTEDLDSTQTQISDGAFPAETGGFGAVQACKEIPTRKSDQFPS
ncbi:uncharacterized protein LOC120132265 [Hibiscus syriacus]|uniref:uncharacterized protein LOC120132265 n=1 Tax=Hibiscus syriacus TaxID=106335 RepID=UPI001923989B|nr:uncharacterized protein LOC120132265 [Hibiscus syriacus]